jgi:hypothetical protein
VRDKGYSLSYGYREPLSISSPLDLGITNAIFQPFTIENVVTDEKYAETEGFDLRRD